MNFLKAATGERCAILRACQPPPTRSAVRKSPGTLRSFTNSLSLVPKKCDPRSRYVRHAGLERWRKSHIEK